MFVYTNIGRKRNEWTKGRTWFGWTKRIPRNQGLRVNCEEEISINYSKISSKGMKGSTGPPGSPGINGTDVSSENYALLIIIINQLFHIIMTLIFQGRDGDPGLQGPKGEKGQSGLKGIPVS